MHKYFSYKNSYPYLTQKQIFSFLQKINIKHNSIKQKSHAIVQQILQMILIFCVLFLTVVAQMPYQRIIHNIDPEARCLDGSPAALFIHQGSQKDKFMIYFEGGGMCSGINQNAAIQDCYKRSQTKLGSSKYFPQLLPVDDNTYLSTNPLHNKFATWTKIIIPYCDGSMHQGYRAAPISYQGKQLYFRGATNVRAHLKWLEEQYQLSEASSVLVTGSSAGAIATYLWANYIQSLVKDPQVVKSAPDSGIFLQFFAYHSIIDVNLIALSNSFKLANLDEKSPLPECNEKFKGREWRCIMFENAYKYQKTKTLVINSEYDSYVIPYMLNITCLTKAKGAAGYSLANCSDDQKAYIEKYRQKYMKLVVDYLENPNNSIWSISCSHHVYAAYKQFYSATNQMVPKTSGITVEEALYEFALEGKQVIQADVSPWPENTPCAY